MTDLRIPESRNRERRNFSRIARTMRTVGCGDCRSYLVDAAIEGTLLRGGVSIRLFERHAEWPRPYRALSLARAPLAKPGACQIIDLVRQTRPDNAAILP